MNTDPDQHSQSTKTGQRVVKNVFFGVASQIVGGGLFFLGAILIARHLGPENFGPFSFVFAFVSVIHMVADFGLSQVLVREISRNKESLDEILGATVPLVTLFAALGMVVIALSAEALPLREDAVFSMYILGASVLMTFHAAIFGAVSKAFEQMGVNAIILIIQRVFFFILVVFVLYKDGGLVEVSLCFLGERIAQWLLFRVVIKLKYSSYRWKVDLNYWKYLVVEGLPVGAGMVLRRISWYLDVFILTALSTAGSVGLFSAAFRIIQFVNVIPFTLAIPVFPVFSRIAVQSTQRVFELYTRVLKIFVVLSLPLGVWLLLLGPQIMITVFGDSYQSAGLVLSILGLMVIFLFINSLFVHLFSALNNQKDFMKTVAIAVTVNVILDFLLIPIMDIQGAAFATLVAEVVLFVKGSIYLHSYGLTINYQKLLVKPLLSVFISSLILIIALQFSSLYSLIGFSILFGLLYLIVGYFSKAIHDEDIKLVMNTLQRRKARQSG